MHSNKSSLTLKDVIITSRPISWINTAAPFFVGYILGTSMSSLTLIVGLIYFLLPYNILMYGVNDIYDWASDMKNPRKNSIEGGLMPKPKHTMLWRVILAINLPFFIYFMVFGNASTRILFGLLIFFCLSYSAKPLRFKEIPFIDSVNSALHFVGPLVFGLAFSNNIYQFWPVIVAFLCWGIASQAFGAVQDIKPDRIAKIRSIATYLGARRTNTYSLIFYSLCCLLVAVFYFPYGIVAALFLSLYILNVMFFRKFKSDAQSSQYRRGWKNFMWLNIFVGFWLAQLLLFVLDPFGVRPYYTLFFGFFLLCFFFIQLGNTLYNIKKFSRPKTTMAGMHWPKISVLIQAYNQQDNISSTLLSILGQQYPQFEILLCDLGSTDNTRKIAQGFQDPRLKIVDHRPIEAGWTLHTWVSQELLQQATGDIVIVINPATIMLPNAFSIISSMLEQQKLSLVSLLAADQNKSIAQQIILSQNQYLMLGMYPSALLSEHKPEYVGASGSCIAFQRSSIMSIGGFELVKKSPLEDFDLAAGARAKGLKTAFYQGSDVATTQDHSSLRHILTQNLRRFYPALHFSFPLTLTLVSGGFVVLILPSLLLLALLVSSAYTGIWFLAFALGLSFVNRMIISVISKQSIVATLLYPIGVFITLCVVVVSMLNYELLRPRWQKRTEAF